VRAPAADGIEVLIDVPDHLQAAINSSDLHQVLLNLVLNACDAMRPGPGTLAFSARVENDRVQKSRKSCIPDIYQSSGRGDSVVLRVVDTGSGIDPELVERIFDPLVTTKVWGESRKQQGGGSGLGLTICKRLVERAGGRITLRSEPGIGSCFSIVLPRAVESHSDPRSAPLAA
jgi:two-component system, NtrC family, sensor kinase